MRSQPQCFLDGYCAKSKTSARRGLAHAVGLDHLLYPGFGARPLRKRLTEIAAGKWTAPAPDGASVTAAAAAVSGAAELDRGPRP